MSSPSEVSSVSAKVLNARFLLPFLKCLHFRPSVVMVFSDNGIKMTVEEAKVFQVSSVIKSH